MPKKTVKSTGGSSTPDESERIMPPLVRPRSFFSKHKAVAVALLILIVGAAAMGTYYYQSGKWDRNLTNQPTIVHREKLSDNAGNVFSNSQYQFELTTVSKLSPLASEGSVTVNGRNYKTLQLNDSIAPSISIIKQWTDPSKDPYFGKILNQKVIGEVVWYAGLAAKAGAGGCDVAIGQTASADKKDTIRISVLDDSACASADAASSSSYDALVRILSTFKFTNQTAAEETPVPSISLDKTYVAKNFKLTFQYPTGFDIQDAPGYLAVAQTPYETRELGDDNAFMRLTKYSGSSTKASVLADYKKSLKNPVQSQVTIDGLTFTTLTGEDVGRYEGDSAGQVKVVLFNLSWLEIIQRPADADVDFDPITVGTQILNSFKFSN